MNNLKKSPSMESFIILLKHNSEPNPPRLKKGVTRYWGFSLSQPNYPASLFAPLQQLLRHDEWFHSQFLKVSWNESQMLVKGVEWKWIWLRKWWFVARKQNFQRKFNITVLLKIHNIPKCNSCECPRTSQCNYIHRVTFLHWCPNCCIF